MSVVPAGESGQRVPADRLFSFTLSLLICPFSLIIGSFSV